MGLHSPKTETNSIFFNFLKVDPIDLKNLKDLNWIRLVGLSWIFPTPTTCNRGLTYLEKGLLSHFSPQFNFWKPQFFKFSYPSPMVKH